MKIVFSYYFHNVPLYFSYSQREYLSSQINISNPFFHRLRVGGFLLYRNKCLLNKKGSHNYDYLYEC